MWSPAALLLLLTALATAATADAIFYFNPEELASQDSQWQLYGRWASHHEVAREPGRRFSIFVSNARNMVTLQLDASSKRVPLNVFADHSEEELNDYTSCSGSDVEQLLQLPLLEAPAQYDDTPDAVDWREKHAVTHVKNQRGCGSCWAFATTGMVEGRAAINNFLPNAIPLSEQFLLDCTVDMRMNNSCKSGSVADALDFTGIAGGIPRETMYPYRARKGTCDKSKIIFDDSSLQLGGWFRLSQTVESLKRAVAKQPVVVLIATDLMFHQWPVKDESGIAPDIYHARGGPRLNHAVLVVGYGANEIGDEFWIVKNSWGRNWGVGGYINISTSLYWSELGAAKILTLPMFAY